MSATHLQGCALCDAECTSRGVPPPASAEHTGWTPERVLQRWPRCCPLQAPAVAQLMREAQARRREDTGEALTWREAEGFAHLAHQLAQ